MAPILKSDTEFHPKSAISHLLIISMRQATSVYFISGFIAPTA